MGLDRPQGESSRLSVNQRLAQAREQDLRRQRNLERRNRDESDGHQGPGQPSVPQLSSTSSSSRAGLVYLSATSQGEREREQSLRTRQLKRQVAGPIPPGSWQDDFERLSIRRGAAAYVASDRLRTLSKAWQQQREDVPSPDAVSAAGDRRASVCFALRHFCELQYPRKSSTTASTDPTQRSSLRDITLCVIADALNRPSAQDHPSTARSEAVQILDYVPGHMRSRMLDLCGRYGQTRWNLTETVALALVQAGMHPTQSSRGIPTSNAPAGPLAPDRIQDDWQSQIEPPDQLRDDVDRTTLDLSFSNLSIRTIKTLVTNANMSLKMLSLAGQDNLDILGLTPILSQIPNLELLSLAGSNLNTQASSVFLRKVSRLLPKLRVLDLSYCDWVTAETICAVSWDVTFPRLEHLILTFVEAFQDPRAASTPAHQQDSFTGQPAASFVAAWHAKHCRSYSDANQREATGLVPAGAPLYDTFGQVVHTDPFTLFAREGLQQHARSSHSSFHDYTSNAVRPAIVSHMAQDRTDLLMEYVRCPRSSGKIEMWTWQRVRVLDAVRGRLHPHSKSRSWIEVWF